MIRSYPYGGANMEWKHWADQRGFQYKPNARCLHWIAKGRCGVRLCQQGHQAYQWMDHVTGWIDKEGRRMLLCQPYWLHDVASLVAVCERFDLRVDIHGAGWYGHGTIAIELRSSDR